MLTCQPHCCRLYLREATHHIPREAQPHFVRTLVTSIAAGNISIKLVGIVDGVLSGLRNLSVEAALPEIL